MANNDGLRSQFPPYGLGAAGLLSPRPMYGGGGSDFPSPTSYYAASIPANSPSFFPMAYNISPRFGGSAFIPSADVFGEPSIQGDGPYSPRPLENRGPAALASDPVAMHLLVETAMIDSQNFDILSVEEVEALKQEQKGLDTRLGTVRRRLESETKIRDAARSLTRLNLRDSKGHQRGMGSKGSLRDNSTKSQDELDASNKKVEDLTRELLEVESRMRLIDMQLLMHTAAVLQLTHNGPRKRKQNPDMANGGIRRPDSPASIYTYENDRGIGGKEDGFDERSLYRSPENLDSLMNALQNGTHHRAHSLDMQKQSLASTSKRLEELNGRLREVIVQANPERNEKYSLPPRPSEDTSSLDRQLDFLDQGLRDIRAEQANQKPAGATRAAEERLEGINAQLYAMLSASDDNVPPPPSGNSSGFQEQLDYMEDSFYSIERMQYALNDQLDDLRAGAATNVGAEKYENELRNLWQTIQRGEEEARERKRQRRQAIAEDPDNTEELSPDESDVGEEQFSLFAFSSKVQTIFRRAMLLKDKQSILVRQIKQQRELNSKSDAQREEQVNRLNEQVLSARSEKKTMEAELERAMSQLKMFDERKMETDSQALRDAQQRATALEAQLKQAQDEARAKAANIQTDLAQSTAKMDEASAALASATAEKEAAEKRAAEAASALSTKEEELRNLEGEVVRLTTELTFAKAELDGAYGTRAERAAESGATTKKELDELTAKNATLLAEIAALQKVSEAASQSEQQARDSERNLKAELAGMASEYEELTRDAIQNEKDRDALEASIDRLRDEKEALELELSDERVKWLGIRSPSVAAGATTAAPDQGATSIRMLREDFRKMMRDRTAEALRALRAEQEERRKLEAMVRQLRKEASPAKSGLSKSITPAS